MSDYSTPIDQLLQQNNAMPSEIRQEMPQMDNSNIGAPVEMNYNELLKNAVADQPVNHQNIAPPNNDNQLRQLSQNLFDSESQKDTLYVAAAAVLIGSEPVQKLLKSTIPSLFSDTSTTLVGLGLQGLLIGVVFIILKKTSNK
jgi:hypothetical protein